MKLLAIVRIALGALGVNKLRSSLTMLGIIIGVASVITMLAVGRGAQARIEEQIASLGTNVIVVSSGTVTSSGVRLGAGSGLSINEDDAAAIERELAHVKTAPTLRGSAQIVAQGQNWSTQLFGVSAAYHEVRNWDVIAGRRFVPGDMDGSAKVALLGQTVTRSIFGDLDPVGQVIRINRVPFTVLGVLERKGQNLMGQDQDDAILVPISTARTRVLGQLSRGRQRSVNTIWVKVRAGYEMKTAESELRELLRARHRLQPDDPDDFYLRNLSEVLATQETASRALTALLAAIASVSLLVGGIGIMNIMLVSVTERTREIGLRMAVGARGRDILMQFVVEAITLALIGGLIGIVLGSASALLLGRLADWRVEMNLAAMLLAFGFSAAIGMFFGFYPARKAARLSPIEALRHE